MRFAVVVLACVVAVANAQINAGKYVPDSGRYQYNNYNKNQQYNRYNRYNTNTNTNQYNRYQDQYNPFGNTYNRRQQYNPFQPFATSTPFPRPTFTVTPAPSLVPKVTPSVSASASVSPSVTPAPVVPVVPVAPVATSAPFVPIVTAARVVADGRSAEIVKYGNEINPDGAYNYFFETSNGIAAQAQGEPRNFGSEGSAVTSNGAFSWYSPEGQLVSINWVADENGYQPSGDALPQPPPLPDQIARALAYVARSAPVPAVAKANVNA